MVDNAWLVMIDGALLHHRESGAFLYANGAFFQVDLRIGGEIY